MKKHYSNKLGKKMSGGRSLDHKSQARKPLITALEPRLLLDGAAVATAVEVISDAQLHHDATQTDSNHTVTADSHKDTTKSLVIAPTEVRAVDPAQNNGRKEVVFIETNVADYQSLVNGTKAGVEVVLLDSTQDGLSQMTEWAKTHSDYDAIHIISHGSEGSVNLGALNLDSSDISGRTSDLAQLGSALNEQGDLLLYGCDVASGEGQAFIDSIAQLTQADVAASNDITGAAGKGGDWVLEKSTGQIDVAALQDVHYQGTLAAVTFGFESGVSGLGTKTVTQDKGGEILKVTADQNLVDSDSVNASIDEAKSVSTYGGPIASWLKFEVEGGKVFDFTKINIYNANADATFTFTANDGAAFTTSTISSGQTVTIDLPSAGFQGVSNITMTSSDPAGIVIDFDSVMLTNITAASALPNAPSTPDLSAASDTGISSTDNITNDTTPTFTIAGVTDGAMVTLFNDANSNGTVDGGESLATETANGTSIQLTTSSALTSGTYNIKAIQTVGGTNSAATSAQSVTIDTTAPTETITSATFSADTTANGGTNSDFITKTAEQTVSGTLSANLASGESVYVSLDNGESWTVATASVGSNTWSLAGQTLTESSALKVKVTDKAGNDGAVYSQAYVLDTSAPTKTITSAAFSADTAANGGTNSDWITKTASQTVSGTLSANLAS
ncbi:DUF4347 domain-containing protein, partial [Marinomonas spartinae]|uniref:DUF4347 domain-containing protein n=1 Tax=Marinomonas spartinae TaxID=1792290 RepID=UPI0018F218F0